MNYLNMEKMKSVAHRTNSHPVNPLAGSLVGKYPVILDGGKTIIFISDKSKEAKTILKYEKRKNAVTPDPNE